MIVFIVIAIHAHMTAMILVVQQIFVLATIVVMNVKMQVMKMVL
jgi:hypothetical protein